VLGCDQWTGHVFGAAVPKIWKGKGGNQRDVGAAGLIQLD